MRVWAPVVAIIRDTEVVGVDDWRYCDTMWLDSKDLLEAMWAMPVQARLPLVATQKRYSREGVNQKVRRTEVAWEPGEDEALVNRHSAMSPLNSGPSRCVAVERVGC